MHHAFRKTPNLERSGARSLSFDIDPDENIPQKYIFFLEISRKIFTYRIIKKILILQQNQHMI